MSRRELKAERRRREILRSAARSFRNKGFHATTMEDIAADLLMTQGSLYYYFKSKEEILFACHDISLRHILGQLEKIRALHAPASAKARTLIEELIPIMGDDLYASAMALGMGPLTEPFRQQLIELRDRYESGVRAIIREGVDEGEVPPANPRLTGFFILGAMNWVARWFRSEGPLTAEKVAQHFAVLFLRSLGVDAAEVQRRDLGPVEDEAETPDP
jgi:AcrR family transcriptional regulator